MAQPSSSHRDREHDSTHRSSRSTHHHHRTISSTTLLLVLSLILAVLAVMLSLPSQTAPGANPADPLASQGVLSLLSPKRSQALITRERDVALREAEVARREAELLAGAPGGVIPPAPAPCPACPVIAQATYEPMPIQTVVKEVVKEEGAMTPPGWWKESNTRFEDILARELKIAEREREISRREETVNRREHDASRREAWIMERLAALGNEAEVEEEYIYEQPASPKRRVVPNKEIPLPPVVLTETAVQVRTVTQTQTHIQIETPVPPVSTVAPPPANTRRAASPTPSPYTTSSTSTLPRTTSIEVLVETQEEVVEEVPVTVEDDVFEEEYVEEPRRRRVRKAPPPPAPPAAYRPGAAMERGWWPGEW